MRLSDDPPVAFGRNVHTGVGSTGRREPRSILGRVVEFELAVGLSRGDGWGARRQTDAVEIALDGARLGEGGDDLHRSPAGVACGDVHLENTGQQAGPLHTMAAPGGIGSIATTTVGSCFGEWTGAGYDVGSIGCGRGQDTVIAHQVQSGRRHQGGQFFYQF